MSRLVPFFLIFLSISVVGTAAEFTPAQLDFFEKKIRPILSDKCYKCHSAGAEKLKSGLQLDHREHLLKGGDSGPALDLEHPEKSFLIETVSHLNLDIQMPPKEKLSDEVIADFKKWISEGAAWPEEEVPARGEESHVEEFDLQKRFSEHWSWRPVGSPEPPAVKQSDWPRSSIDHFILNEIEKAGLRPAESAGDRIWLRRVYFDLTGLPPTPENIDAFLKDESADRKERVVDALLASSRFGEKWARHWMDLVRYAETYGHEFDYPIDYSHEYRDYLIRAFNEDVPYDQFAKEHIAGDLLKDPRIHPTEKFNESVLGTGFWYLHEATHAPTDVLADESDHHDNQIDVFAKSFLGLTVACARCHDHKFDAISTADYYALTGYLHSSARTERSMDPGGVRKAAAEKQLAILNGLKRDQSPAMETDVSKYFAVAAKLVREQLAARKSASTGNDEIFEDFEKGFEEWKVAGKAFGNKPVTKAIGGQKPVTGFEGKQFANSFALGNEQAKGQLVSKEFTIAKPFIHFRIGGGNHNDTSFGLQIDGKTVLTASGQNGDKFRFVSWDVTKFKGKKAQLRLMDNHEGAWGHVLLDHIVFSDSASRTDSSLPVVDPKLITETAKEQNLDPELLANWCRVFAHEGKDVKKPFGFLSSWLSNPDSLQGLASQQKNLTAKMDDYLATSTLFEDFGGAASPDGWSTSGEGFHLTGPNLSFTASESNPLLRSGLISSRFAGENHEGVLRSPTFTIESDQILVKLRAEKAMVRIVIDNYHMAKFNALLFRGTTHKDVSTEGEFTSLAIGGDLKRYRGHKAYLEFVDKGPGFVEIDEIRFFDSGAPAEPLHPLIETVVNESNLSTKARGNDVLKEWLASNQLLSFGSADEKLLEARALNKNLPSPRFAITMAQGTPENAEVYIRGSHRTPGEQVPHRFLEGLGAKEGDRLTLAEEIVSPDNPLTSRVIVNRLWHHLFGKGIVPTVDDFGPMGQRPTHPALLDWLAHDFVDGGWSIKDTLRKIVLSKTYGQAGKAHSELDENLIATADPTNALLHHMPVRRLQSESIRDSILAVSGSLNEEMYGASVPTHRTAFMTGRGARGSGPLDGKGRRSVYGSIYRNFLSPFQLAFDMPSPFGPKGRRSVSNVPAQALALMNDPFVIEESRKWATKSLKEQPDLSSGDRIEQMFEKLTGQIPDPVTREKLVGFLKNQSGEYGGLDDRAWSDLAHALFNTKSFLYLN